MIDSDPKKLQLDINNSIAIKEYTWDDIIESDSQSETKYLLDVADFLIDMAESNQNVPDYLNHNTLFNLE